MVTSSELGVSELDTTPILASTKEASAFMALGVEKPVKKGITVETFDFPTISSNLFVGEGVAAVADASALTKIQAKTVKQVFTIVVTEESEEVLSSLASSFENAGKSHFARSYDRAVSGEFNLANPLFSQMTLINGVAEVPLDETAAVASLVTAKTKVAQTGYLPTAWVLSIAMVGILESQVDLDGRQLFPNASESLLGLPVKTFASAQPIGIIGDWNRMMYSQTMEPRIERKNMGSIVDSNGVTHNLTSEGKTAYMLTGYYSSAADLSTFVRLTPPAM